MDHSYSKERTKVQKIDHSYFTVGKKTPAVVLRKAQLQKQDQCQTRPGVDQDHSYTRPDLSDTLIITEIFDDAEREQEEEGYVDDDENVDSVTPCTQQMYTESFHTGDLAPLEEERLSSMPTQTSTHSSSSSSSQAWRSRPIIVQPDDILQYEGQYENEPFDYGMESDYSSQETELHNIYSNDENQASTDDSNVIVHSDITYDLDEIDCLISDINLDHAYEVRSTIRPRRRMQRASYANGPASRQNDDEETQQQPMDDGCVAQGDHNYLDLHASNDCGARSGESVRESSPSRYSFRFDDHTYLQSGRTKGASTHSIERVLRTDHTYLQSDEYSGTTSRIRKAKSETNLTGNEQRRSFVGSSWCQRSDDHTYLNTDEGQRMGEEDQGSDDSHGTADCVHYTQLINDDDKELAEEGCYRCKRPYRHSCTGLVDHSYEADIYRQIVNS